MPEGVMEFLAGAVAPAFVLSLVVFALAWGRRGEGEAGPPIHWISAAAIALGTLLGIGLHVGWPDSPFGESFPPNSTEKRLFYLGGAAVLFAAFEHRLGSRAAWIGRALLAFGAAFWVLWNLYDRSTPKSPVLGLRWGAATLAVWGSIHALSKKRPGPDVPGALAIAASLASVAILQGGNATYSQFTGLLAATTGAAALVGLRAAGLSFAFGGAGSFALLYGAFVAAGVEFSELPLGAALALMAAPLAGWLALLPPMRGWSRTPRVLAMVVLMGAVAGAGLAIARQDAAAAESEAYDPFGGVPAAEGRASAATPT